MQQVPIATHDGDYHGVAVFFVAVFCFVPCILFIFLQQVRCIPPGEKPNQLQITTMTIDDGLGEVNRSNDTWKDPDSDGIIFINISDSNILKRYRKYIANITAKNDFGESSSTGGISFSKLVNYCFNEVYIEIPCNFKVSRACHVNP